MTCDVVSVDVVDVVGVLCRGGVLVWRKKKLCLTLFCFQWLMFDFVFLPVLGCGVV